MGVRPVAFLKALEKYCGDENPQAKHTSFTECSPEVSMAMAC